MADNLPNLPSGAVPPKPAEAAKVQPKKETVRINLPPKPTAAPTIKLPTPAAVPVTAQSPAPAAAVSPAAAPAAAPAAVPAAPRPPMAAAPRAAVPARAAASGVSMLDQILAAVAALASIAALVSAFLLMG